MTRRFRRDHGDIDAGGRLDGAKANIETVGKHQRLACGEMGRDGVAVELGLLGIGREDHDYVGPRGGFRGCVDGQAFLLRFGNGSTARLQSYAYGNTAIAKIQGMRVALRAVTDDRDLLALN